MTAHVRGDLEDVRVRRKRCARATGEVVDGDDLGEQRTASPPPVQASRRDGARVLQRRSIMTGFARKMRRALETRRTELGRLARANAALEAELRSVREPDWEDDAAVLTSTSVLARLGDAERDELIAIAAALVRLDEGTYGSCVHCGSRIAHRRLESAPAADRCLACATLAEARSARTG